ncbi:hypothetical protein V6N13_102181 [Hibiscus sabdariffa]|uniref:Zinc knuckle CX2CX4HX4C domain-containing protein n=1 Tax=Hibiscus sabdariffa TaxID=183260 RepID=A0ABR2D3A8_9ROSI
MKCPKRTCDSDDFVQKLEYKGLHQICFKCGVYGNTHEGCGLPLKVEVSGMDDCWNRRRKPHKDDAPRGMVEGSHRVRKAQVPMKHPRYVVEGHAHVGSSSCAPPADITTSSSMQSSQVMVIPTVVGSEPFVRNHVPSIAQVTFPTTRQSELTRGCGCHGCCSYGWNRAIYGYGADRPICGYGGYKCSCECLG